MTLTLLIFLGEQECSGPLVAETRIEYTGADAYCEGNSLSATVRHALQLGIVCDFAGVETYFSDILSECFNARHEFDLIDEFGADDGDLRFTCLETATFPPGSTANDAQTLPRLEMGTDPLWTIDPYSGCFNLTKVPQPTFPPTQVVTGAPLETFKPTVAPNQPTVAPRVSPSPTVSRVNPMIPISSTINATAPLSVPPGALSSNVLPPQPVPTSDSSRASGSSNNIGLVVGASAGGAVIVILLGGIVAALVLHTRKRDKGTNKTFETQSKGMGGADANGAGAGNDPTESESGHPPPLMTQGERPYRSSLTRAASIQETTLTDSRASVQHSSSASTSSATSAATTRRSFVNPPISEVADNCKRYMMTDDETSVVTAGNVSAVSTGTGTTRLSVEPEEHCRFEL